MHDPNARLYHIRYVKGRSDRTLCEVITFCTPHLHPRIVFFLIVYLMRMPLDLKKGYVWLLFNRFFIVACALNRHFLEQNEYTALFINFPTIDCHWYSVITWQKVICSLRDIVLCNADSYLCPFTYIDWINACLLCSG